MIYKILRSLLTPNFFRKKRVSCFWGGQITHTRKSRFYRCWHAISKAGWTSRKKVPLGVRLKSTRPSHGRVYCWSLYPPEARHNFLLVAGLCRASSKRPSRPKPKGNGQPIRTRGSLADGQTVEGESSFWFPPVLGIIPRLWVGLAGLLA